MVLKAVELLFIEILSADYLQVKSFLKFRIKTNNPS